MSNSRNSFEVIDNPFIRDLFQELNLRYIPPLRTTLSEQLLDQEVTRVSLNIEKELKFLDHLILNAALIATKLWQSLSYDKQESYELISHLCRFEAYLAPYDLPYIENMDTSEL
ncbi:8720_t:CDS:2 [Funneliformis mosseae]|uniref:8720_t:CDS:1 n=1 Tax=Funneliformis mosseae TaxID=27381 RepID=A0A9N9BQA5_FUNMO|nr:8720_t:CDS:2 [Funneliformis mosseae]